MASTSAPVLLATGVAPFSADPRPYPSADLLRAAWHDVQLPHGIPAPEAVFFVGAHPRVADDADATITLPGAIGLGDAQVFPLYPHEAAGSTAVHAAWHYLQGKEQTSVAVVAVSRFTHLYRSPEALHYAGEFLEHLLVPSLLQGQGGSWVTSYALKLKAYAQRHGITQEQLAAVTSAFHHRGRKLNWAALKLSLIPEEIVSADKVCGSLTRFDIAPLTDGAAAMVLGTPDLAELSDTHVTITEAASAQQYPLDSAELLVEGFEVSRRVAAKLSESAASPDMAEVDSRIAGLSLMAMTDLGLDAETSAESLAASEGINDTGGNLTVGMGGGAHGLARGIALARALAKRPAGTTGLLHEVAGLGRYAAATVFTRADETTQEES